MNKKILLLPVSGLILTTGIILWHRGLQQLDVDLTPSAGQTLGITTESLEARLPADVPLYPGTVVKSFDEKISGWQLVGETVAGRREIEQYFRQALESQGWASRDTAQYQKAGRGQIGLTVIDQPPRSSVYILNYSQSPRP